MRISNDTSALAASVVAHVHQNDLTALGATSIDAGPSGVTVATGDAKQARVMQEIVSSEFTPEVNGTKSRVPFVLSTTPDDAPIGVADAIAAIEKLPGVMRVTALPTVEMIYVGTKDAKDAQRLSALLRDKVLGQDLLVEQEHTNIGIGWGSGIG